MFSVKVDASGLAGLAEKLRGKGENLQEAMQYWAEDVRDLARDNTKKYGSGFWNEIAEQTYISSVSADSAEIVCDHVAGAHKHTGGPIRVRNKSWLTIPINPLSKGKSVARMKSEGYKLFRPWRKGGQERWHALAFVQKKGEKPIPLFALTKETRPQRPFPWWPEKSDVERLGLAAVNEFLEN